MVLQQKQSALSCGEVIARHSGYTDGLLSRNESDLVRTHLKNCPACAHYDRVLRIGVRILNDQPQIQPDPEFYSNLHGRIEEHDERTRLRPIAMNTAAAASIAAVLALAAWLPAVMSRFEQPTPLASPTQPSAALVVQVYPDQAALPDLAPRMARPEVKLIHTTANVSLIDRGYTPFILEAPTAPPAYTRFTSYTNR